MIRTLITLVLFSSVCYSQTGYKFVTDFETTQWGPSGTAANGTWEAETSTSDVRVVFDSYEGERAIWLGDFITTSNTRNEIALTDLVDKQETWWGFAMKIVEPVPSSRSYFQLRPLLATGGTGSGVTNLITMRQSTAGRVLIQTSTIPENVDVSYDSGANPTGCCDAFYFDYQVGEWIDIVVHSIFDDVSGRLELWVKGEKIIDIIGTTAYNQAHDNQGPYDDVRTSTKLGPYWATLDKIGDVYYDKFSVWEGADGSYELVHPLGLSPGSGGGTPPVIPSVGSGKQKTGTALLISH